jgi:hypothetical protein
MASDPAQLQQSIRFGEGYELDLCPRRLRHGTQVLKLERIPFEILLLLLERRDEIVTPGSNRFQGLGPGCFPGHRQQYPRRDPQASSGLEG